MTDTFKARPTIYRGIQMRSRLEAAFAQVLDESSVEWVYCAEHSSHEKCSLTLSRLL